MEREWYRINLNKRYLGRAMTLRRYWECVGGGRVVWCCGGGERKSRGESSEAAD